jgi:3',5'-cyclic AMP phosphodiesterase CpdA
MIRALHCVRLSAMNRRSYLQLSGAACLAAPFLARSATTTEDFQFAFLTDIHVQPEKGAGDGLKKCLAAVKALSTRPDFVMTGGDLIMDSLATTRERIKVQWNLFDECWKQLELPSHHTIGNHDVGGWSPKSPLLATDADYGKRYFADRYGKGSTWRSFDHRGWHFIVLDSIKHDPGTPSGFIAAIDDEQLDWLKNDLAAVGKDTPVIVVTHVPFFSVISQHQGDPRKGVSKESLVTNAHEVRKLFDGHNVKLVLSGHGHVVERIEFGGISYIQAGSVCGAWWRGRFLGNPEGFGVVTCRADGTFDFGFRDYGWKPPA